MRAHRGEGTRSPEPRCRHMEPRAQTRAQGAWSPDVDTQARGHTELRCKHTGRGHTEPGAQTGARVQGSLWSPPLGLCPEDVLCAMSCHNAPAHKGVASTSSSNITTPRWPSKAGPSIRLLPCRARSVPPRSRHVLPGGLRGAPAGSLPAAPTPPSSHSYTRGPGEGPHHSTWISMPPPNFTWLPTPALQEATVPRPRLGRPTAAALSLCGPSTGSSRALGFPEDSSVSPRPAQGLVNTRPRGDRCFFFKNLPYHTLPNRPSAPC